MIIVLKLNKVYRLLIISLLTEKRWVTLSDSWMTRLAVLISKLMPSVIGLT